MAQNKARHTGPEVRLRKACWALGLRYKLHAELPGHPDMAFPSAKVAVFVDGCFWHGCPLHYQAPVARREFWEGKLKSNRARDVVVAEALCAAGWHLVRIWEHDLRNPLAVAVVAVDLYRILHGECTE